MSKETNTHSTQRIYSSNESQYSLLYVSILVASIAGFLIGYDTVIISGALLFIKSDFALNTNQVEVVVSSILITACIGAALGWPISLLLGRRSCILTSAFFFLLGPIFLVFSSSYYSILVGRSILGLGIGLVSMSFPIYISEIVPPNIRGSSICLVNLVYFLGAFLAYVVGRSLAGLAAWRWMLATTLIPALAFFILTFFIPETPQWYLYRSKFDQAKKVLAKLRRSLEVQNEYDSIVESLEYERQHASHFWTKGVYKALFIGFSIAIFMEITGFDAVLYYAPVILSGYNSLTASINVGISIGLVSLFFSFFTILFIDLWGRRKILLYATAVMVVGLFCAGALFRFCPECSNRHFWMILSLMVYAAGFSAGLGAVGWLLISEIYPLKIRSFSVAASVTIKWIANFVIARYFLSTISTYGLYKTLWIYALITAGAWVFIYFIVPETAGKSLETIEEFWIKEGKHGTEIEL